MVFRYCFGMIMSVSTLMIFKGAATPSSVVNFSMTLCSGDEARVVARSERSTKGKMPVIPGRAPFVPRTQRIAERCAAEPGPYKARCSLRSRLCGAPLKKRCTASGKREALIDNLGLDRFHVGIREPEVMADLVDQHMAYDMAERLVVFGPVIQD